MYLIDLNSPEANVAEQVLGDEFVYAVLKHHSQAEKIQRQFLHLKILSQKNKRTYVYIGGHALEEVDQILGNNEARWVGVEVQVGLPGARLGTPHTVYSNIDQSALNHFANIVSPLKHKKQIIPEFIWNSSFTLGPTIFEFVKIFNPPFVFIRTTGSPDEKMTNEMKDTFEYLRLKGFKKKIYFNFDNKFWNQWSKRTLNTFSGLELVHVDLSNKCTHSCVFCGLWGSDFIEQQKENGAGQLSQDLVSFMSKQMSKDKALEILEGLPETVHTVQFGGAGDPLTHPNWLDIITSWRGRGLKVEVLTNFEYPSHDQILSLHSLCNKRKEFEFLINVSAANAETYKLVRPRQNLEVFEKVISNIRYAHELKERDGQGLRIIMLHVINRLNFKEAVKMVDLAYNLGTALYLKPLEIHGELHRKYTIPQEERAEFKKIMKAVLSRVDELGVELLFRDMVENITTS